MLCAIFCKYASVRALVRMHVCVVNYVNVSEGVCKSVCFFFHLTSVHPKVILDMNAILDYSML